MPVFELKGKVQNYAWGKIGKDSLVAQIHSLNSHERIEENEPYAEVQEPNC